MSEPRTFLDGRVVLHAADCRDVLRDMADNSVDSVVTDPPYALVSIGKRFGKEGAAPAKSNGATGVYARASKGFMGCVWDTGKTAFDPDLWADVCRVMKPGAHAFIFGGDRTYHRLACAVEDGGLEIRKTFVYAFGSGFPKSHNIALDYEKKLCEQIIVSGRTEWRYISDGSPMNRSEFRHPDAIEWEGWGTDTKPAVELICLARKPISENSIAESVRRWGTGAINVGKTRISPSCPQPGEPSFVWLSQLYAALDTPYSSIELALYALQCISSALRSYSTLRNGHAHNADGQDGIRPSDALDNERFLGRLLSNVSLCDLNWKEALDSLGDCLPCRRLCDEHIRLFEVASQESAASLSDALAHMYTAQYEQLCSLGHRTIDLLSNSLALFLIGKLISNYTDHLSRQSQGGRWPANLILDGSDEVLACFPETASGANGGGPQRRGLRGNSAPLKEPFIKDGDFGSAARFFASFPQEAKRIFYTSKAGPDDRLGSRHPTVKPLDLKQYLVRLVTPKNGVCLDHFAGTGTTGEACFREGFRAILIENDPESIVDIERRMSLVMEGPDTRAYASAKARNRPRDDGPLFGGIDKESGERFIGSDGVARLRKKPLPNWIDEAAE